MPRYLIEIPHEASHASCERMRSAIEFLGSHFMTNADWGCEAGVHSGWLITELENKDEAMRLVPPPLRQNARIVQLKPLTLESLATQERKVPCPQHEAKKIPVKLPTPEEARRAFASPRLSWA